MANKKERAQKKTLLEKYSKFSQSPPPASHLLAQTLDAFYWLDNSLQNQLKKNGWTGITRLQSQVLTCLGENINRTSEIAHYMCISKQVVSRSVKELVEMGIIELSVDPDDKRANIIVPTEQGKEITVCAMESLIHIEATLKERIGEKNVIKLQAILEMSWGEPLE
jgi:DNA-binding MarR family transcriptional regulator